MFKKDFVVAFEEQHTERGWTRFSVQSTPSQLGSNPDWSYETCQSYNQAEQEINVKKSLTILTTMKSALSRHYFQADTRMGPASVC